MILSGTSLQDFDIYSTIVEMTLHAMSSVFSYVRIFRTSRLFLQAYTFHSLSYLLLFYRGYLFFGKNIFETLEQ